MWRRVEIWPVTCSYVSVAWFFSGGARSVFLINRCTYLGRLVVNNEEAFFELAKGEFPAQFWQVPKAPHVGDKSNKGCSTSKGQLKYICVQFASSNWTKSSFGPTSTPTFHRVFPDVSRLLRWDFSYPLYTSPLSSLKYRIQARNPSPSRNLRGNPFSWNLKNKPVLSPRRRSLIACIVVVTYKKESKHSPLLRSKFQSRCCICSVHLMRCAQNHLGRSSGSHPELPKKGTTSHRLSPWRRERCLKGAMTSLRHHRQNHLLWTLASHYSNKRGE